MEKLSISIEQKAKAYDEALEKSTQLWECGDITRENLEYIFSELKEESEDEDERIRKALLRWVQSNSYTSIAGVPIKNVIDWFKRQGEHKKFRDSIQVGDEVTRNSDGVIVNMSQLKRVAKPAQQKLPIEKLPEEMKTIGESLGFTTQEECDEYNQMVSELIMSDNDKGEQKQKMEEQQ